MNVSLIKTTSNCADSDRTVQVRVCLRCAVFLVLLAFLVLFTIKSSLALGISPADIIIRPSDPQEFTFMPIFNGESGRIAVRVDGDFAQYITLDSHTLAPGEAVHGVIRLPEDAPPGVHDQRIVFSLAPSEVGTVSGAAEVAGVLSIRLPYPNVYLRGTLTSVNDPGTDISTITVTLENLGAQSTITRSITIDVVNIAFSDAALDTMSLSPTAVSSGTFAQAMTSYDWTAGLATPGEYSLRVRVPYESSLLSFEKNVTFGTPRLNITSLVYRDDSGTIKPIDVTITSRWNRPLAGVLEVYYDNGTVPVLKKDVQLLSSIQERIYLDTAVLGAPQRSVRAVVTAGAVSAFAVSDFRGVETAPPTSLFQNSTLLIIAALLVVALLGYMLLRLRKKV